MNEDLQYIRYHFDDHQLYQNLKLNDAFCNIENQLKQKEKLEKVWKIVKEKRVVLIKIVEAKDYLEYNQFVYDIVNQHAYELLKITENEFNFLKEMLGEHQ